MTRDIVIVGCGGFGREVVEIVDAINDGTGPVWNLLGFLDDSPSPLDVERARRLGLSVIGPIARESLGANFEVSYIVGIGSGTIRRAVVERADSIGLAATILLHPTAVIGRDVRIQEGTVVAARAQVTTNVDIGRHVHVDRSAQIGHDSTLGNFSTIHPSAVVSGNCHLGEETELGTNCTVLPGVNVGNGSLVGAAACVVNDVKDGTTVAGVPARPTSPQRESLRK